MQDIMKGKKLSSGLGINRRYSIIKLAFGNYS